MTLPKWLEMVVIRRVFRLLSTDTIKDESLWEAESALAQLWEHEDRVVSKNIEVWEKSPLTMCFFSRTTRRGPFVGLDPEGSRICLSNLMQWKRRWKYHILVKNALQSQL